MSFDTLIIKGNISFTREFLRQKLPEIRLAEPEGTYLVWLDFRGLNLTEEELEELVLHRAGLWLDRGTLFGKAGAGFERMNVACPRGVLQKALEQLEAAVAFSR